MVSARDFWLTTLAVAVVVAAVLSINAKWGPDVPRCRIVGDHEIDDHRCIPYCPPKPSECG